MNLSFKHQRTVDLFTGQQLFMRQNNILIILNNENGGKFLVLSGIWGSGKTETAKEVYRSVTGKTPTIITDLEKKLMLK